MKEFHGKTLRWNWRDGIVEVVLDREPLNEIGTSTLAELEQFVAAFKQLVPVTSACIFSSARPGGFCAGADLKELYRGALPMPRRQRTMATRKFLNRIHKVFNALDAAPFVTIAAVHGLCMG
ncbi:MAG TPA: enoyl-CoA hydratase/isomerase family protein, partial [Candidatus Acidoferrum sp.]